MASDGGGTGPEAEAGEAATPQSLGTNIRPASPLLPRSLQESLFHAPDGGRPAALPPPPP